MVPRAARRRRRRRRIARGHRRGGRRARVRLPGVDAVNSGARVVRGRAGRRCGAQKRGRGCIRGRVRARVDPAGARGGHERAEGREDVRRAAPRAGGGD